MMRPGSVSRKAQQGSTILVCEDVCFQPAVDVVTPLYHAAATDSVIGITSWYGYGSPEL